MNLNSNKLLATIKKSNGSSTPSSRMAKVTQISGGSVYLTFYGEEEQSSKPYKRLSSYTPAVGDTVLLQNVNGSYLITGKVV